MEKLGVGLIYLSQLDALYHEDNPNLAVLELEPETFWDKSYPHGPGTAPVYTPNAEAMDRIRALPQKKLVHSVGFPVGGTEPYVGDYLTPLRTTIDILRPPWASAHLSFNTIGTPTGAEQVGFLLPPRQTAEGVAWAVENINRFRAQIGVPLAFETGVNYLKPRSDELSDGEFFAAIAEGADCGILLDLHNLWANERNGRQTIASVLDELPLERVWEIHLAGGAEMDGYYLDAHSGAVDGELQQIAADVIPRVPNLGALNFEIQASFIGALGLDGVREQLAILNALWHLPRMQTISVGRARESAAPRTQSTDDVAQWERTLGNLAVGHPPWQGNDEPAAFASLGDDPAIPVFQKLIGEFRRGLISRALHYTTIVMIASWGRDGVRALLTKYESGSFPDAFASSEGDRFASFLRARLDHMPPAPYLREVVEFEHALLKAALYGERSTVRWEIDPGELFESLDQGRVPETVTAQAFSMEIVPQ